MGELSDEDQEEVELRLLSDAEFANEFDISVDELIDLYVDGELEDQRRKRVESYFLKAPERQQKLQFARALRKVKTHKKSARPVTAKFYLRYLAIAACIVVVLGVSAGLWRKFSSERELRKGLIALHEAYREQRPLETCISDFNYAPVSNQRGAVAKTDYVQRDLAANFLLKQATEHPSAASHHALGQYYLAGLSFDQAIEEFQKALTLDPGDAKLHNDLGAAWLEKVMANRGISDGKDTAGEVGYSLEHLNKALQLNPSLAAALFNRALCYEYLLNREEAIRDFQGFLLLEPSTPWAAEAAQHIKALNNRVSFSN